METFTIFRSGSQADLVSFNAVSRLLCAGLVGVSLFSGLSQQAYAASDWPNKPIQLVVTFPPGGSADQMGRLVAPHIAKYLGQSVVVENRSGAGGMIGTSYVAKAGDHTFGVIFDTHATNAELYKDSISFDALKDINYVTLFGTAPLAIFTGAKSPYQQAASLLNDSKSGQEVSYGTVGTGGLGHLAMVSLARQADFKWDHVAYRGGGPLHMDVAAGHIPIGISSLLAIKGLVDGGTLLPLAVTTDKRSSTFPEVPTVSELGYTGFNAPTWWGMVTSSETSPEIVEKMHQATSYALQQPDVVDALTQQGVDVSGLGLAEFQHFVESQIQQWANVIQENSIKVGD